MPGKPGPPPPQNHGTDDVINIALALILTIVTCGIYGLIWQYQQMEALNRLHGREEYNFLAWLLLSIITCGIFAIYYEYKMGQGINEIKAERGLVVDPNLPLICLLLALFQLAPVSLAIQQSEINKIHNVTADF